MQKFFYSSQPYFYWCVKRTYVLLHHAVISYTKMSKNDLESKSAFDKRVRRHVNGRIREHYAVTTPGFEKVCLRELTDLDCSSEKSSAESGGVTFFGRFVDCMKANLHLRTATRVLLRIATFSATNRRQLEKKITTIPWELFLPPAVLPDVKVRSVASRLYHTDAITDGVQAGIRAQTGEPFSDSLQALPQTIFARVVNDRFTLSLDSSGEPLYKRGLKYGPATAPIRETLAAAILQVAGYDPRQPLVDPFCGSGTFSLEAAMMAKQMAPGLLRRFAFLDWPAFRESQWNYEKKRAKAQQRCMGKPCIFASDVDRRACAQTTENLHGRNLFDAITVQPKNFFHCYGPQYGKNPGLVVINPPYGIRLGSARAAEKIFSQICRHLTLAFKGWTVALIAPDKRFLKAIPFPVKQMPFTHGGLKVTLCLGKKVS